jgi:hypothetical protein
MGLASVVGLVLSDGLPEVGKVGLACGMLIGCVAFFASGWVEVFRHKSLVRIKNILRGGAWQYGTGPSTLEIGGHRDAVRLAAMRKEAHGAFESAINLFKQSMSQLREGQHYEAAASLRRAAAELDTVSSSAGVVLLHRDLPPKLKDGQAAWLALAAAIAAGDRDAFDNSLLLTNAFWDWLSTNLLL